MEQGGGKGQVVLGFCWLVFFCCLVWGFDFVGLVECWDFFIVGRGGGLVGWLVWVFCCFFLIPLFQCNATNLHMALREQRSRMRLVLVFH